MCISCARSVIEKKHRKSTESFGTFSHRKQRRKHRYSSDHGPAVHDQKSIASARHHLIAEEGTPLSVLLGCFQFFSRGLKVSKTLRASQLFFGTSSFSSRSSCRLQNLLGQCFCIAGSGPNVSRSKISTLELVPNA